MLFKRRTATRNNNDQVAVEKTNNKFSGLFRRASSKSTVLIRPSRTWSLSEDEDSTLSPHSENNPIQSSLDDSLGSDCSQLTISSSSSSCLPQSTTTANNVVSKEYAQLDLHNGQCSLISTQQNNVKLIDLREVRHQEELKVREDVIRRVLKINKQMVRKHRKETKSLAKKFHQRLQGVGKCIQEVHVQHRNELDVCNAALSTQQEELLQAKMEIQNQQEQLRNTMDIISTIATRNKEEIEVYDEAMLSQEEELLRVKSELEVARVHLQKSTTMLIQLQSQRASSLTWI